MVVWCGSVSTCCWPPDRILAYLLIIFIFTLTQFQYVITSEIFDESQSLTPPYFNLAYGRKISATATCGEDIEGPELYCKLVGANADNDDINVIQGQVCDYCDPRDPKKNHNASKAIDGVETWWQSPPLSRGAKYNEVNLTIDFGQEFHVAYVFIKMGNSPRPGLWVLEKSVDYGKTYTPWQYFSESPAECEYYFGKESLQGIVRDNSVICTTEYSQIVPLEGGEIPISLLKNRPSANMYFNSTELQEWTRATNVRLRFLRTKTLLGHLMSVARQDPTVTRRYFYSIKDISIGGRCMCNGHADTCQLESKTSNKLICQCVHRTCGPQCAECCPNYVQKKWRQSTSFNPFVCEKCNCFNHADECKYDPEIDRQKLSLDIHGKYDGGGVCLNCKHNTEGINCNKCKPKFYRPYNKHWNETDVCQSCDCDKFYSTGNCAEYTGQCECRPEYKSPKCDECNIGYFGYPDCRPCECNINGTKYNQCESNGQQCPCKFNFNGSHCDRCADGFYKFPECLPCECNARGSTDHVCNQETGNCTCNLNYQGRTCDECSDGYYNYPTCVFCDCDKQGTEPGICNKTNGTCLCKKGYGGNRCDHCIPGYYGFPDCKPCNCSDVGSVSPVCDSTGSCPCLSNFASRTCEQCSPGFYKYPECIYCNCYPQGSNGVSCDNQGRCQCHDNFFNDRCDQCKEGFYNFPNCEECNCHPAGVVTAFAGCGSVPAGQLCECKERVQGRICDKCKPLFWNLNPNNPDGCEECTCHIPGVMGGMGVCDTETGQCVCKPSVTSQNCNECKDGAYNLQENNLFGCTDCNCDIGGSVNTICHKKTGQCQCHPRIQGETCNKPAQNHYFPTLHQYQYETEDGHTPRNNKVRFGFYDDVFPNFSWKGYAVFSDLQKEVIQEVYIHKSSLYRMILRYINTNQQDAIGDIVITPDNPSDVEQKFRVVFKPTKTPTFVTVSGNKGIPSPFVMNPGIWAVSITINNYLLLDYFVLLPAAYYEATILTREVKNPCIIGNKELCRQYGYPNISDFNTVHGVGGFISMENEREKLKEFYGDLNHLRELGENEIPVINKNQLEINFDVTVSKPGKYVLLVNYLTPHDDNRTHDLSIETRDQQRKQKGRIILYACPYTTLCRQVVTDREHRVAVFNISSNNIRTVLMGRGSPNIGIKSITFIPYDEWSLDYILPKPICVQKDGLCVPPRFPAAPDSKKVQIEIGNEDQVAGRLPPNIYDNTTQLIHLTPLEPMIDVSAKVPQPGQYVFVVHFYQPNYPAFDLDVVIHNGQYYEGKLPVPHCPSNTGCRSIVKTSNDETVFNLQENFVITLKEPDTKTVWIDYILVIPAKSYSDKILFEEKFDQTKQFITQCGQNNFYINTTEDGFCRDSVFSLTSAYNNGAKPCQCDFDGSSSFECEIFGGQCPCKPHIIGRKCEICKTGYYGFPDCQPCNCPSTATCEPNSGKCICLPHVIGPNCDKCEPFTYGFDQSIGCEECKCDPLGVLDGNLQCDLLKGNCSCKPNVIGRTCNRCEAGYHSFPYCEECECDDRGTTAAICDLETAECFCKDNVYGNACDLCQDGSFNLQETNPEGCTKCFCFGKTSRCSSSDYYRIEIEDMDNWLINAVDIDEENGDISIEPLLTLPSKPNKETLEIVEIDNSNKIPYVSAPITYLGNKLTSYGGVLKYNIFYYSQPTGLGEATYGPDVILKNPDTMLFYTSLEAPTSGIEFTMSLELIEQNFILANKAPATRDTIMLVLENLSGIYLRANYWNQSVSTRISSVSMEEATSQFLPNSTIAYAVEQCQCPPNYVGLSCEKCAPGYYRIDTGPHGGYCVPCQCNGHSNECDVNTGICLNCQHNTTGDHCEKCEVGFHGDATNGSPRDCLICACPIPLPSNNFGIGCDVSADGEWISCECKEGYTGSRCQACSNGYYGKPEEIGDYCKPCNCSGNINPEEDGACDTVSGECLKCLHNTFGRVCELCRPGFYGDAIHQKNCQQCDCDDLGTELCDNADGTCQCKPNVVGQKCDRCEQNYYGFESGAGCLPCNCGVASLSSQCDPINGQCRCQPGVTGRTCDVCASGFWNYTESGCISCGCHSEYSGGVGCNQNTGKCDCLPNVKGIKCDHCESRWVFIPGQGCFESDTCVHDLLDVTDEMKYELSPIMDQFQTISSNYFTSQRLTYINNTVNELIPTVKLLDSSKIDQNEIKNKVDSLDQNTKTLSRKIEYALDNSNQSIYEVIKLVENATDLYNRISEGVNIAFETVDDVNSIAERLETGSNVQLGPAIEKSRALLDEIKYINFTKPLNSTKDQLKKSEETFNKMVNFSKPKEEQFAELNTIQKQNDKYNDLLNQITEHAHDVHDKANKAEQSNYNNRDSQVTTKVTAATERNAEIEQKLNESSILLKNTTALHKDAVNGFNNLSSLELELLRIKNTLNFTYLSNERDIEDVRNDLKNAEAYKDQLVEKAEQLQSVVNRTKSVDDAVEAAEAYKTIVLHVKNATKAVNNSMDCNKNATILLDGLQERTVKVEIASGDLLQDGTAMLDILSNEIQPKLKVTKKKITDVEDKLHDAENTLSNIDNTIANIQTNDLNDILNSASDNIDSAEEKAARASELFGTIDDNLSEKLMQAKQLPKDYDDATKQIIAANENLNNINKVLPNLQNLMDSIAPHQNVAQQNDVLDIQNKIEKLKGMIAQARDEVNRINVGVQFYRNSTLQLKNPPNLPSLGTSTKVSFYFQTENRDGFLFYLGNENGTKLRRTNSDDFMAVEIENGFPVLTIDLGSGPKKVIGNKHVADNQWYQLEIERIGKNVKLIIREEVNNDIKSYVTEEKLEGTNTIFNLDQEQSKIYVGGYPLSSNLQLQNNDPSFEGKIEELVIDDQQVSLWNFIEGVNIKGAKERDKLINIRSSTGYRFGGKGYIKLDARQYIIDPTRIFLSLKIKTDASDGLIFLTAKDESFLSLEVRNGFIIYQYKLGSSPPAFIQSFETVNDGKWHYIEIRRLEQIGRLKVNSMIYNLTSSDRNGELKLSDDMYFGGYPGNHDFETVTNVDFDGCIDDVNMESIVDLNAQLEAFDITEGCPPKFYGAVSFDRNSPGYLLYPNATTHLKFEITLTFSTLQSDGLIFYTTNQLQNDTLSLSLVKGNLILKNKDTTLSTSSIKLNDGEKYVVTATHDPKLLQLVINDYESFSQMQNLPTRKFTYKYIYFGGIPTSINVPENRLGSRNPFAGCIEDVTLNGVIINFANVIDKSNSIFGTCSASATLEKPILPPRLPKPAIVATETPLQTTTIGIPTTTSTTTTTIAPPKQTSTVLPPADRCALPLEEEENVGYDSGYRFGTLPFSRIEYGEIALPVRHKNKMNISLDIKLDEPADVLSDAILFYATDKDHTQFVALLLSQSRVEFRFKVGDSVASIINDGPLNDGQWHTISVSRHHLEGKLTVDDVPFIQKLPGESKPFTLKAPFYFGGISPKISNTTVENLGINNTFNGCIRNIHHNGKIVGEPEIIADVVPCTENVEHGIYFTKEGGYVRLYEKFRVGVQFRVQLDIKPRRNTGIILSVHGRKDYLILTLKNGDITVVVNNGDGPFEASFKPNSQHYICNGNWHSIQVLKSKNVVTVAVDNVFSDSVKKGQDKTTDTKHGLFIGGHPYASKLAGFHIQKEPYVGCMRNILINDKPINIREKPAFKGVRYNICPVN